MSDPDDTSATPDPDEDLTAVVRDLYDLPYHHAQDIEVVAATREGARLRCPFDESLVGNVEVRAVHGGVISALADVAGAAPFVASLGRYTPTVDLRMDFLNHAGEADLVAESAVRRRGGSVGTADVTVYSDDERVAVARGVYKLSE